MLPQHKSFLSLSRWKEMEIDRRTDRQTERGGISSTLRKSFHSALPLRAVLLVVVHVCVKGCVEKKWGSYPPPQTKGADGWPSSALGWGGASRRLRRSAVPSHGVHFSSPLKETADRGALLITRRVQRPSPPSLLNTLTPPHHWPMTLAPRQVTCTVTMVGEVPK